MRILLAVLLATSFAHAMNIQNGDVEVLKPVDPIELKKRMYDRVQKIKRQVVQLDIQDMGMAKVTAEKDEEIKKTASPQSLECLEALNVIAQQKYFAFKQAKQRTEKENQPN